jgi:Cu(I)/Ag(I) efflux system membrane fusion protein
VQAGANRAVLLIEEVAGSGQVRAVVTVTAPIGGVIQTLDVRAGMNVAAGAPLARITGLATVWLEAAVPEAQGALVGVGRPIEARFAAFPGETLKGRVISVLPENSADSRTLRVRAELPNSAGRLRPGMYAQVRLSSGEVPAALLVPSEAVIRTGRRNVVIVAGEGGRFQPVEVEVGRDAGGRTAILQGLEEGQKVVASGQFLIDSEASLKGVLARLGNGHDAVPAAQYEASGKVEAVGPAEITLSHGPVKSLGWGAMTMAFKLARPDLAASLKAGDAVHFWFRRNDDKFIVEKVEKSGAAP